MSHGWRTGSNHVLIEYHNRPAFFVNHMRDATRKSLEVTQDMVETISLETGEFKVRYSILIFFNIRFFSNPVTVNNFLK